VPPAADCDNAGSLTSECRLKVQVSNPDYPTLSNFAADVLREIANRRSTLFFRQVEDALNALTSEIRTRTLHRLIFFDNEGIHCQRYADSVPQGTIRQITVLLELDDGKLVDQVETNERYVAWWNAFIQSPPTSNAEPEWLCAQ
jgi:hypothetical protein